MFVGAPLLALAFLGARSSRGARLLAIAAAVFLWLALGVHLGSDQLLRHVPVWGSFRYAEKLTGPLVLCLAILAGLGASRLPAISVRRWKWGTLAAASLAGGVLVFLVAGGDGALESWPGETAPVGRVRLAVGLAHLCLALAGLAAAAFLLGSEPWAPGPGPWPCCWWRCHPWPRRPSHSTWARGGCARETRCVPPEPRVT